MNPSEKIDQYIARTNDWKGEFITRIREIVHEAAPDITEEWKWNSPVFTYNGKMICSPGAFKKHVGINFFDGASLKDPDNLFNSGLDAKKSRSVNYYNEEDEIKIAALKELIKEAIDNS